MHLQRRPDRRRPGDRPGARDRARSSASSRSEHVPTRRRGRARPRPRRRSCRRRLDDRPPHPHDSAPTASSSRASSSTRPPRPASRRSRSPTTTPSPALPRAAARPRDPATRSSCIPGVEINAVAERMPRLARGRAPHPRATGWTRTTTAFEAALAAQRAPRRAGSARSWSGSASSGMPIDAPDRRLDLDDDDALGRPTVARALSPRATRRASRTPSTGDPELRAARLRPAPGPRPVEAIEAIRARRRTGVARALPRGADRLAAAPRAARRRAARPRGLLPLVRRPPRVEQRRRPSPGELGLVATGGTDYHGDPSLRRGARRRSWVPPKWRLRASRRHRAAEGAHAIGAGGAPAAGTTVGHPMTTARCPSSTSRRRSTGPAGPRDPPAPADERLAEFRPEARALPRVLRLDARLPDEPAATRRRWPGACSPRAAPRRPSMDAADLVVINTCAIREAAEAEGHRPAGACSRA